MLLIIYCVKHDNVIKRSKHLESVLGKYTSVKISSILTKSKVKYAIESLKLLLQIYKEKPSEIVLIEPWYMFPLVELLIPKIKTKLVYLSGNINYDIFNKLGEKKIFVKLFTYLETTIIRHATVIISDSFSLIEFFRCYNSEAKIYYVPEYIGDYFSKFYIQKTEHRTQIKKFTIGYLSSIHLENVFGTLVPRGWEMMLVGKKLVALGVPDFKILIIGDGIGLESLRAMVHKASLDDYFSFEGYVEESRKDELLGLCDVAYSEDYESYLTHRFNLSSKIEEYMLSGIPIVTGKQGDKSIIIEQEKRRCGICIDPLNDRDPLSSISYINNLTNAILKLIKDKVMLSNLKYNCMIESNSRFSKLAVEELLNNVFLELLTGNSSKEYEKEMVKRKKTRNA